MRATNIIAIAVYIMIYYYISFYLTGVWLMHCHIERHLTWGMDMVFIVKNGPSPEVQLLPPPPDMPPC